MSLTMLAPAKINLTLSVGDRRADGYHELRSVMMAVDLCDRLTLRPRDAKGITLRCDDPSLPSGPENLVWRAVEAIAGAAGCGPNVEIELTKRIPAGAGLGGGSSDAAATLRGLNELGGLGLGTDELTPLAAGLGSDVPFFLHAPVARITGRGEHVEPLDWRFDGAVALWTPAIHVSTAAVYARHRPTDRPLARNESWLTGPRLDARTLSERLYNDLEPAAIAVDGRLGELRGRLAEIAGRPIRLSGSGSAMFGLFDTPAEVECVLTEASGRLGLPGRCVRIGPSPDGATGHVAQG